MRGNVILVSGYAASGKSRVGKELAWRLPGGCYLDKDTISGPFVDRMLLLIGRPAGDRDSEIYRSEIRPLEYQCLLAAGFEAAESGATAVLSAPFLAQLVDAQWMNQFHRELGARGLCHRIVWVHCNLATLQQRMLQRGSLRDRAKLNDWAAYSASLDEQFPRRIMDDCFCFENSGRTAFDVEMQRLIADLTMILVLP